MFTYIISFINSLINYYYPKTIKKPVELSQKQIHQLQSYHQSIRKATDNY